jgi:MerR family transcriptional regulator, heat shock protein HspR
MMSGPFEVSDDTPVYVISVAAQLSGLHPQTLRAYDRLGLVSPGRSAGRGRRYSLRDILILREVQRLSQEEGVNLSGIKRILELEAELDRYRQLLADMTAQTAQVRAELESTRAVAARLAGLLRGRVDRGDRTDHGDRGDRGREAHGVTGQPETGRGPGTDVARRPALPAAERALPASPPQPQPAPGTGTTYSS